MPEKVIDIRYPENKNANTVPKEILREKTKESRTQPKIGTGKSGRAGKRILLLIIYILIITVLVSGYFILPKAKIEIWPQTQTLQFQEKIEVLTKESQADFVKKILPGKVFEESLEVSQEFQASGTATRNEKSKGAIQVYNAYSDSPQSLVAGTRFISAEGKLFKSVKAVTIPGGTYDSKGKLTPGLLDVEVVAAEPGEGYDIGPSTFSIPGFSGTPKYTSFYGKSFSPMTGGSVQSVPQITESDLEKARKAVSDKFFSEGKNLLIKKMAADSLLLEEAIEQNEVNISHSEVIGAEKQTFTSPAKGHLKAIIFKKSDAESFTGMILDSRVAELSGSEKLDTQNGFWGAYQIQDSSIYINYKLGSIDWQSGKLTVDLDFSAKIYPGVNSNIFRTAILGKSMNEVNALLTDQPIIDNHSIKLSPFWVKSIPKKDSKVEIKINLGD